MTTRMLGLTSSTSSPSSREARVGPSGRHDPSTDDLSSFRSATVVSEMFRKPSSHLRLCRSFLCPSQVYVARAVNERMLPF